MTLLHCLSSIQLTEQIDTMQWRWDHRSILTTKSAYWFIKRRVTIQSDLLQIWKSIAPPRVFLFTWLALKNKILTIDNIAKRGWTLANICYLCRQEEESVQHLFQQCCYTATARQLLIMHVNRDSPASFTRGGFQNMLLSPINTPWQILQAAICFNI
jgi:zinc-binding in reverse transcriptase